MGIAKRIAFAAASLALVAVLIAGVLSYRFAYSLVLRDIRGPLQRDLSFTGLRLEQRLDSISQEVRLLSSNQMVVNALIDSAGRETYIVPFLKSYMMKEDVPFTLTLYDFSGHPLASNNPQKPIAVPRHDLFANIFGRVKPYISLHRHNDRPFLLIAYPVVYRATKKPEGFLAVEVDISEVFERTFIIRADSNSNITISSGSEVIWSRSRISSDNMMKASEDVHLRTPLDTLNLNIEISEDLGASLAPLKYLAALYFKIGISILAGTLIFAYLIGKHLSRRLIALNDTAGIIAERGLTDIEIDDRGTDEIAGLASAFKQMLLRLKESHDNLERRVIERTVALTESEKKYRLLFDAAEDAIFVLDMEGRFIDINRTAYDRLGYTREEIMDLDVRKLDPPEFAVRAPERFAEVFSNGQAVFESAHCRKDGTVMPVEVNARVIDYQGRKAVLSIVRDITERVAAEKALRENEYFLQTVIETEPECIKLLASDGTLLQMNRAGLSMIDAESLDQVKGQCVYPLVAPTHREAFRTLTEDVFRGKSGTLEFEAVGLRGRHVWLETHAVPLRDDKDDIIALLGVTRDITKRKQAEEDLRESEERFRSLFENIHVVALVIDPNDGSIIDANTAASSYYGWSREQLLCKKISDINTLSSDKVQKEMGDAESEQRSYFTFQHLRADGLTRDVEVYSGPIRTGGKTVLYSFIHDITERRKTEKALRESEERYRRLFEVESDAILLIDFETQRILDANAAALKMYGYGSEEFLRLSVSDLSAEPAETRRAIAAYLTHVPSRRHRRKDGTEFFVEIAGSYFDYKGREVHVAAVRDVTERKQAEKEVLRSLAEKEVLLKEIHHRVKNNMQVVSSLLTLQSKHIKDDTVRNIFNESRNRINSMSLIHEKLYGSDDLAHIDFSEYVDALVKEVISVYKRPDISFSVNMSGIFLDINTGIPCGLIINELVSNSLKHAFPVNKAGMIRIEIKDPEGSYVLTVEDDGIGFPADLDFRDTLSLGMQLVTTLTAQINGTIKLSTEHGTTFMITFPIPTVKEGATI